MDPELLFALRTLVDRHRLRIVARLAARPADAETLASELRQPIPSVRRHLQALLAAGLVESRDVRGSAGEAYAARLDRVGELGRALAALEPDGDRLAAQASPGGLAGAWPHDGEAAVDTIARLALDADEMKILRSYLVDGRLQTIPAQHRKRQVILRFLLERVFAEDRAYPEKEVNQRLAVFDPDVAALRRYLVDDGYVDREAGMYRRRMPRPGPPAA